MLCAMATPLGRTFEILDEGFRRALRGLPWFMGIQTLTVVPSIAFFALVACNASVTSALSGLVPLSSSAGVSAASTSTSASALGLAPGVAPWSVPESVWALMRLLALPTTAVLNNLLLGTVGMVLVTRAVYRRHEHGAPPSVSLVFEDFRRLGGRAVGLGGLFALVACALTMAPLAIAWVTRVGFLAFAGVAPSVERLLVVTVLVGIASGLLSGVIGFRFVIRSALAIPILAIGERTALESLRQSARSVVGHGVLAVLVTSVLFSIVLFFSAVTVVLGALLPGPDDVLRAQALSSLFSQIAFVPSSILWATCWGAFYDEVTARNRGQNVDASAL